MYLLSEEKASNQKAMNPTDKANSRLHLRKIMFQYSSPITSAISL